MSLFARIVKKEDIDYSGSAAHIDGEKATEYTNLQRIGRPYGNAHGDWTETFVLIYKDGSEERVRGHLVESGVDE